MDTKPVTAEDVRELVTHLRKSQHPIWCNSRIQLKAHDRCDCGLHQAADLLLRESLKAQAAEAETQRLLASLSRLRDEMRQMARGITPVHDNDLLRWADQLTSLLSETQKDEQP